MKWTLKDACLKAGVTYELMARWLKDGLLKIGGHTDLAEMDLVELTSTEMRQLLFVAGTWGILTEPEVRQILGKGIPTSKYVTVIAQPTARGAGYGFVTFASGQVTGNPKLLSLAIGTDIVDWRNEFDEKFWDLLSQ